MTVEEFLTGMESRLTAATPGPWEDAGRGEIWTLGPGTPWQGVLVARPSRLADVALIAAAPSDLAKLTTAIRNVLDLHEPNADLPADEWCLCDEPWPCPTVRAITDALGDES